MIKSIPKFFLAFSTLISPIIGNELINFSAATDTSIQKNIHFHNDAKIVATESVRSIDLGQSGNIGISNISIPSGPFSIEAKFFLRDYNNLDPMISDITAAFDCSYKGTGTTEGFDFRIGGGYLYPLQFRDVYDSVSDWVHPSEDQKVVRSIISKSVGEFALGTGDVPWKEIYTNRCIERNTWNHMVAVWDGSSMQIYLNGYNATDPWRNQGKTLKPFVKDTSNVTIGAENSSSSRHFNGKISFVKIYNTALSPDTIYKRYRESIDNVKCTKFIKIESPRCGEVITPKTKIQFSIEKDFECDSSDNPFNYHFEVCHDQSFTDSTLIHKYQLPSKECTIGDIIGKDSSDFNGLYYIRIKGSINNGLKKAKVTADDPVLAESGIIPTYAVSSTVKVLPSSLNKSMPLNRLPQNRIFDCNGRLISGQNISASTLKNGIYLIKTDNKIEKRVLFNK